MKRVKTNDAAVWAKAWSYKDHGKSYDAIYNRPAPGPGLFNWIHESFGTNWRMTEMQATIGRIQLRKLRGGALGLLIRDFISESFIR